jgi:tetraacyldisaccharide 4'-kinase
VCVDLAQHKAEDVGDEPLLLARVAPVVVSRDRVSGADAARKAGASVIVMDDGFQNPSLRKDVALAVVDSHRGVGNACVFPSGPLRAPLAVQLDATDVIIASGDGAAAAHLTEHVERKGGLALKARIVPASEAVAALRGKRVLAFAGIGDPERFFATLRASNIDVVMTRSFADHHTFTVNEIAQLVAEARAASLTLVTTEKDFVRIGSSAGDAGIQPFPVALAFEDEAVLRHFMALRLVKARAGAAG